MLTWSYPLFNLNYFLVGSSFKEYRDRYHRNKGYGYPVYKLFLSRSLFEVHLILVRDLDVKKIY